jgi:hypothetical protein
MSAIGVLLTASATIAGLNVNNVNSDACGMMRHGLGTVETWRRTLLLVSELVAAKGFASPYVVT